MNAVSTRLRRVIAIAAAMVLSPPAATLAAPPPAPVNLLVLGGQENWHAENNLRLDWEPTIPGTVAAVHFRVRDEGGAAVLESRIPGDVFGLDYLQMPRPGRYRAEVWLEGGAGEQGPAASASFLFDDTRPGPVQLSLPAGWVAAGQVPLLRISHPLGPLPIAGIRGYAVSATLDPGGAPCHSEDVCVGAEVDLSGGIGDDSLPLPQLPEGTVHVDAVAVSGSGIHSALAASGLLRVDLTAPTVTVLGAPAGWINRAVTVTADASDERSGMVSAGAAGPITSLSVDGSVPRVAAGDTVSAEVAGEGIHLVRASARDLAGNRSDREGGAVIRIDRTPPRLAFAAALDRTDPELLTASVSDGLSGPDPSRGTIAVRAARSHRQFSSLPTAVENGYLQARWDSDRYPPGQYEFLATGYDRAGNAGHSQLRAGGMPMLLPAPLKARPRLLAGFGGRSLVWHRCVRIQLRRRCRREVIEAFAQRPASRTVLYGRRLTVGGVLTAASGAPLSGQSVELAEIFGEGEGASERVQELTTASDGSFFARLAPGPSRRIEFSFAGTRTMGEARARPATLTVRAGVGMRSSAAVAEIGGRPLVFSGTVFDAGAIPAGGKTVELQFRLPGLPWREFRSVRTNASGRFRYPYRFSDDDSRGVRFQFRALVPAETGWPYAPATSRPIPVVGK